MSNELTITFSVPPGGPASGVVPIGRKQFRLHTGPDGITLPEVHLQSQEESGGSRMVTVHLPARIEVLTPSGGLVPAHVAQALVDCWVPQEFTSLTVDGPRTLSSDTPLPTALVHPVSGPPLAPDDEPLRLEVLWSADFASDDHAGTARGRVLLEFAPPGEAPGPPPPVEDDEEFLLLRDVTGTTHEHEFVVIDFGTTASTATLHDPTRIRARLVDPAQTMSLAENLTELLAPPADAPAEWRKEVEGLLSGTIALPRRGAEISGAEALARVGDADVADALMLRVEALREQAGSELRQWLNRRLHSGYADVIGTPPLHRHGLRSVEYEDVSGQLTSAPASTLREKDYEDGTTPDHPRDRRFALHGGLTGIKRAALQLTPEPVVGTDMSADHLAQHMYLLLVEGAEQTTLNPALNTMSKFATVVVTYPTTILPEVREKLGKLVRAALGGPRVVMDFDEGLAAGLFFLMSDLTDNLNAGLEALRARCRRVGEKQDPPTWQRIMLVIDIGGGTTDIALLRLTLVDQTPKLAPGQEFVAGRDYRLEPELLGSTGHERLGGDLLTLQVFYWIKARLVDELRPTARPETDDAGGAGAAQGSAPTATADQKPRRSYAETVAEQAADELDTLVSDEVRRVLASELPTDWIGVEDSTERNRRKQRFDQLWRLAEQKKRELGAPGAQQAVLEPDKVANILNAGPHRLSEVRGEITLDSGQFDKLVQPVLRRAAALGADLVRGSFRRILEENAQRREQGLRELPEPQLDQVVLSGRTSRMAQLKLQVEAELRQNGTDGEGEGKLGWHEATQLSAEVAFAKEATSLGAAWAHTVRNVAGQIDHDTHNGGRTGATVRLSDLDIRLQGLFSSLPADFGPRGQMERVTPLLRAGDPYIELDGSGRLGVRTGWNPLSRVLSIHRYIGPGDSLQWGVFDLALSASAEGFIPSPSVWRPPSGSGRGVRYQLELDNRLVPHILLCNGPAHLLVEGRALELDGAAPGLAFDADLPSCSVPGRICVSAGTDDNGERQLVEVFPPSEAELDGDAAVSPTGYLPESFHETLDLHELPQPGRRARITVPPTEVKGSFSYEFYLDRGDGAPVYLGYLTAVQDGQHHATLDARGRLRVHRGVVPYLPAGSLRQVEEFPGRVLRERMDRPTTRFNHHWDPNSGRH
ncbi:virulence factor SrfB [Streptomyces olivochromogenes]|uniref:virulence factor SrfB n=1 Tax=Streptomyces olivochromogenes TaxID=1963 RepID=UPI001F368F99|nr:virulence factor SrfB [Streptomyces olivochromogenes]MCF3130386.1 virulence factor SrfB [Streptomyces olivochromogenes]